MTLTMCGIVNPNCLTASRVNLFGRVGSQGIIELFLGCCKARLGGCMEDLDLACGLKLFQI